MGFKFNNTEAFYDKEVAFTYEGQEMLWNGDYNIHSWGENPDYDYAGDCETEIIITHTDRIETWSEELQDWVELVPTPELLEEVKWQIEKSL